MLFFIKSAPCRLAPNEALPHTPLGALPLDPTSPLAPGLSVRFISRFARCFILLYACNLLWSAMLIPHSSLKLHSSLSSYCILILFKQSTLLGVEQLVNRYCKQQVCATHFFTKINSVYIKISEITNINF